MRSALALVFLSVVLMGSTCSLAQRTSEGTVAGDVGAWTYVSDDTVLGYGAYPEGSTLSTGSACRANVAVLETGTFDVNSVTFSGATDSPDHLALTAPDGTKGLVNAPPGSPWSAVTHAFDSFTNIAGTWVLRVEYPSATAPATTAAGTAACAAREPITVTFSP
jgi:hypothetical protein